MLLTVFMFISWPLSDMTADEIDTRLEDVQTYLKTDLDSAIHLASLTLEEADQSGYELGQAKSDYLLGLAYNQQGKTELAVPHFLDALSLYMDFDTQEALEDQADICMSMGRIYRVHNNLDEAIAFYERGVTFALKIDDNDRLAKLLYNQAVAYRKKGEFVKAADLIIQKLKLLKSDNKIGHFFAYNQMGLIQRDLGEFNTARFWFNKMVFYAGSSNPRYRGQAFHNIAGTYKAECDYQKARSYYLKALQEKEPLNRAKYLFVTYHDLAELALEQCDYEAVITYSNMALPLIDKVPKTPEYFDLYHLLSKAVREDDPDQALAYSDAYVSINQTYNAQQEALITEGNKYKIALITSAYMSKVKQVTQRKELIQYIIFLILLLVSYWLYGKVKAYLLRRSIEKDLIDLKIFK